MMAAVAAMARVARAKVVAEMATVAMAMEVAVEAGEAVGVVPVGWAAGWCMSGKRHIVEMCSTTLGHCERCTSLRTKGVAMVMEARMGLVKEMVAMVVMAAMEEVPETAEGGTVTVAVEMATEAMEKEAEVMVEAMAREATAMVRVRVVATTVQEAMVTEVVATAVQAEVAKVVVVRKAADEEGRGNLAHAVTVVVG